MSFRANDQRGSTLYLVGELVTLSHTVFPGPNVIHVSETSESCKQFLLAEPNSDLETISTGIYQKIVHIPNVYVTKVISGRHHTHLVTFEGKVLSFGSNSQGELCCGKIGSVCDAGPIAGLVHAEGIINEYKIIDGSAGGYHSLFISIDGSVFCNGSNSTNQLGIPNSETQSKPVKIPDEYFENRGIFKVGANNTHSIFITKDYKVYVAGSDSNGCCGGIKSSSVPLALNFPIQYTPIDVSCGYDDTKLLTSQGVVLGCGCGSHGRSVIDESNGNESNLKHQFEGVTNIIKISNGYFCQSYQTSDLKIYGASEVKDEFLENFLSGDYDIYVTKEFNPKTRGYGHIKKIDGTDLTGEFKFEDLSEKVGIASQRNHFIIHTYRDDYNPIHKHFLFLEKLVRNERRPLSDIKFVY